ncbi:DUF2637 domain-containing protein [Antribacter gilvus]|uniref:DUF2637 domain-containing protein n=1 Tax=Antribacter gilvus TaxID=2304675 RepID=UPI0013E0B14E|nr:DUF2637 domain-containing protein [Antribacter gilvus]
MARAARLDPDTLPSLIVAVVLTATLGAVSFTLSYAGLVGVAAWAAVPGYLAWTVPVTIDASILVYTLAVFIFRARGESNGRAWTSLILFTAVSVAANAAHAWDASAHDWHGYAGAFIAGLAPVSVLLTTHTLAELVVVKPEHRLAAATAERAASERAASERVAAERAAAEAYEASVAGSAGLAPLAEAGAARPFAGSDASAELSRPWDAAGREVGLTPEASSGVVRQEARRTAALDSPRSTSTTARADGGAHVEAADASRGSRPEVADGELPPPAAAERATAAVRAGTPRPRAPRPDTRLGTDVGEEILDRRAKGEKIPDIAAKLKISESTVRRRIKEYSETGAIPVVTQEQLAAARR